MGDLCTGDLCLCHVKFHCGSVDRPPLRQLAPFVSLKQLREIWDAKLIKTDQMTSEKVTKGLSSSSLSLPRWAFFQDSELKKLN